MSEPEPDEDVQRCWMELNRIRALLVQAVDRKLRQAGLPPLTWYDILWTIEKRGGAVRPQEVRQDLIFEPSALSHMARRMEKAKLIETVTAPDDGRGKLLTLTPAGREARRQVWKIYAPMLEKHLAPLSSLQDIGRFTEVLRDARQSLQSQGENDLVA